MGLVSSGQHGVSRAGTLERHQPEADPRRPPLGPLMEGVGQLRRCVVADPPVDQVMGLASGERQVLLAHLGHTTQRPQPGNRKWRIRPRDHYQVQRRGLMVDHPLQVVPSVSIEQVSVVDHDYDGAALVAHTEQVVDEDTGDECAIDDIAIDDIGGVEDGVRDGQLHRPDKRRPESLPSTERLINSQPRPPLRQLRHP